MAGFFPPAYPHLHIHTSLSEILLTPSCPVLTKVQVARLALPDDLIVVALVRVLSLVVLPEPVCGCRDECAAALHTLDRKHSAAELCDGVFCFLRKGHRLVDSLACQKE